MHTCTVSHENKDACIYIYIYTYIYIYIHVYYDSQLCNWLNYLVVYIFTYDLGKYVFQNVDHELFSLLFR